MNMLPPPEPVSVRNVAATLAIICIGVLVFGVASCAALIGYTVHESDQAHTVTYTVTGTDKADVSYRDGDGSDAEASGQRLPWSRTITVRGTFNVYSVSAQNDGWTGSVGCFVEVDGRVVEQDFSTGWYAIATCDGRN